MVKRSRKDLSKSWVDKPSKMGYYWLFDRGGTVIVYVTDYTKDDFLIVGANGVERYSEHKKEYTGDKWLPIEEPDRQLT